MISLSCGFPSSENETSTQIKKIHFNYRKRAITRLEVTNRLHGVLRVVYLYSGQQRVVPLGISVLIYECSCALNTCIYIKQKVFKILKKAFKGCK